jgi:hypothetical protein
MEHQIYTIDGQPVFSLVAEEDNYESTRISFSKPRPGLYPSEASVAFTAPNGANVVLGKCMREAWYRALDIPKPSGVSVGLAMKGSIGKQNEIARVQRWKEMGLWLDNSVKFFNRNLAVSGELDCIIRNPITSGRLGIEIKTFYGYGANRNLCGVKREKGSNKSLPGTPNDQHFLQSCVYAWDYKDDIDEYRLYYLERGDGHRIEFRVGFQELPNGTHQCYWEQIPGPYWSNYQDGKVLQPYTIEDIHDRYKQLLQFLRDKKLPPKEFSLEWDAPTVEYMYSIGNVPYGSYNKWLDNPKANPIGPWQCRYCDYRTICEQDEAQLQQPT